MDSTKTFTIWQSFKLQLIKNKAFKKNEVEPYGWANVKGML